jgi:hypothetical protein
MLARRCLLAQVAARRAAARARREALTVGLSPHPVGAMRQHARQRAGEEYRSPGLRHKPKSVLRSLSRSFPTIFCGEEGVDFQRSAHPAQTPMLDRDGQIPVFFHVSDPFLRFSREHGSPGAWHSPKSAPAHAAHGH